MLGALDPSSGTAQLMEVVRLVFFLSLRRCSMLGALDPSSGTAQLMEVVRLVFFLKGHSNEADFLGFCRNWFLIDPYTTFRAVPILASNSRRYS